MQEIEFYCKKCKKSMRVFYSVSGNKEAPVMKNITMKCHTNRCYRVITLKNYTEGLLLENADAQGRVFL